MTSDIRTTTTRWLLQLVFVLSGCAALIYQSIWSHYLGLTLGHAAYAQSLVLMMFMGGMALGAWIISRVTQALRRPVALYAATEALIGVMGLAFHAVFLAATDWSQSVVLPSLGSAGAATAWQWLSAAALIAPQTVLLGATFPLIAAGVLRLAGSTHGQTLGGLYFTNGLGAAMGALIATFWLLPAVGMPGALAAAGWLNLAVAVISIVISGVLGEGRAPRALTRPLEATRTQGPGRLLPALLAATFFSSAASFAYELGWVRMLNQALGSSLHSFELMLAAFIAGLALGGLWVRRVGDGIKDLVRYAGFVQVLMAIFAMLSVGLLGNAYHWVPWLLKAIARSSAGYVLYNIATAGIAIVIMVPAAFFAGMTLPLFTAALLRRGAGERAVGQIYAANTLGAILGVVVAAHALMPAIGVGLTLLLAGAVDLVIGLALLRSVSLKRWTPAVAALGLLGVLTLGSMLQRGLPDPLLQSAGVFRYGNDDMRGRQLLYYRDGSTASISVVKDRGISLIATNGKPDAGVKDLSGPPAADEITMVMIGAMALSMHPSPQDVAVIGWGSGLTTHTLLGSDEPKRVDTIEIERAMWEGAKALAPNNARAYTDPRSAVHFEDAREFFARGQRKYDVIASEPSNPWVSGVASLFTQEFYRGVKRSLKPGGVLIQWVHSYEISDDLLAQMISALLTEFPGSEIYAADSADLLILAPTTSSAGISKAPWQHMPLAAELRRVGLSSPADLAVRRLGGPQVLRNYVRTFEAKPHSDFFPTISLHAPQQRFSQAQASMLTHLATSGPPVLQILDCRASVPGVDSITPVQNDSLLFARQQAVWAAARFAGKPAAFARGSDQTRLVDAVLTQRRAGEPLDADSLTIYLANLANAVLPHVPGEDQRLLWDLDGWTRAHPDMPPTLRDQLSLYDAFTRQQWQVAQQAAQRLLTFPASQVPIGLREQALTLGMLAGMTQRQPHVVRDWEDRWGVQIPPASLADARRFMRAWENGGEPVCAAGAIAH